MPPSWRQLAVDADAFRAIFRDFIDPVPRVKIGAAYVLADHWSRSVHHRHLAQYGIGGNTLHPGSCNKPHFHFSGS